MIGRRAKKLVRQFSSWRVPSYYVLLTVITGMLLPRLEHYFLPNLVITMSPSAAMGICGSVASGMIALTGIVFSLVFVMVQFSATAYSPRLVTWVSRDPIISHALGVFSSTFLYSLVMLAWVDRSGSAKVPMISSWLVFLLLLASMAVFIALIDRIAGLQVGRMLIFTGNHGRQAIIDLYEKDNGLSVRGEGHEHKINGVSQTLIYTGRPNVIQAVRVGELVQVASRADVIIEVAGTIGDSVLDGSPLLKIYGAKKALPDKSLRTMIAIGDERTFEQDPKYALRLIVDVAIKALSPAVNDPTTAVQALDQIEDLLLRLGRCRLDIGHCYDESGALRLVIPFPRWSDFLRLGLDEVCYYGATSVQVMRRMMALVRHLLALLPPDRHAALQYWEARIHAAIRRAFANIEEQNEAAIPDRQGLGLSEEFDGLDSLTSAA